MTNKNIEGLICTDHVTYCVGEQRRNDFMKYWCDRGLSPMSPIVTTRYPAEHIALVGDPQSHRGCEKMIGMSISSDSQSPINCITGRVGVHGGIFQHRAYLVDGSCSIETIREKMEQTGTKFMTPIFTYEDTNGATLKQIFTACKIPYGPFVEIIERKLGTDGQPFNGFADVQIDNLYESYDDYSRFLSSRF
jgi:hypothetical protein